MSEHNRLYLLPRALDRTLTLSDELDRATHCLCRGGDAVKTWPSAHPSVRRQRTTTPRDRTADRQALSSRTHATISRLLRPVRVKDPGERLHTGPHACRSSHQGNRGPLQWSSASSCELGSALKQRTGAGLLSRPEGTLSGRFGPVCCSAGPQTGWHPARLRSGPDTTRSRTDDAPPCPREPAGGVDHLACHQGRKVGTHRKLRIRLWSFASGTTGRPATIWIASASAL